MSVQAPNRLHQLALGLQSRTQQDYHLVDQAFVDRMKSGAPTADDYTAMCALEKDMNRGNWFVSHEWVDPNIAIRQGIAGDLRAMRMAIGAHLGIERPGLGAWFRGALGSFGNG